MVSGRLVLGHPARGAGGGRVPIRLLGARVVAYASFETPASRHPSAPGALRARGVAPCAASSNRLAARAFGESRTPCGKPELGNPVSRFAAFAVIGEFTGGPSGLLYPLSTRWSPSSSAFHGLWQSLYFLALILGVEAAIWALQPGARRLAACSLGTPPSTCCSAFLYALFLRGEVNPAPTAPARGESTSHLNSIAAEARDFP